MSFPLPNASSDLTGDIALVTGASSGLGRRFALTLAAAGASVAVAARRADRLESLVAEIESAGGRAQAVPLDVVDPVAIESAVQAVVDGLGMPTILVNNAGTPDGRSTRRMDLELIDHVLDVNLRAPYLMSAALGRRWIEAEVRGRIVNVSSMAAFHTAGAAGVSLYATTKAAVNRMTEALAVEWSRNHINVNAIAPGFFSSEMMDGMIARVGDMAGMLPRGRMGDPAQLDSTLLYLVSPASEMVTGTVIKVDDGALPR
jgi:NAD(P)-dependent dehydrogenase (short-subunit alcohol dehydrogenase family)